MFNRWPRWVDGFEVCPVQLPGRENRIREPVPGSHEALADALTVSLLPYLDRPFVLFGHCAGALPAYEVARRLEAHGVHGRGALVVSAQVAPHDCPHDRFLDLTDAQLLDELAQLTRLRGGEPHPALLELSLEVLRQDLDANRMYRLDAPAPVPVDITVVHWTDDPEVTMAELDGWRCYADRVRFSALRGGHYEFLRAPDDLLGLLTAHLRKGATR
jgi:surfactin synthase thioesterase subunit